MTHRDTLSASQPPGPDPSSQDRLYDSPEQEPGSMTFCNPKSAYAWHETDTE